MARKLERQRCETHPRRRVTWAWIWDETKGATIEDSTAIIIRGCTECAEESEREDLAELESQP